MKKLQELLCRERSSSSFKRVSILIRVSLCPYKIIQTAQNLTTSSTCEYHFEMTAHYDTSWQAMM